MKNNTIKKTSREFRVQASQLARADFRIYGEQMSAFLEYIENTPCLIDYIRSCGPANRDWEKELSKGFDHWSECGISFSPNPKTRTAEVYSLLRHLVDSHVDFVSFGMRYNLDGDCSETIRSFHRAIPQILVDNLNLRLEELEDEANSIEGNMPTISIGTASNVNIAQNHSSISTSGGAELKPTRELLEKLDELSSMLSELTTTQQTEADDCIQEAKSSIMAGTTWSKAKRTFQALLGCVNGSGKLAKSVLDLISLAQTVLPQ